MDPHWILSSPEYYARLNAYILEVGLPYSLENIQHWEEHASILRGVLGDARGQSVLDCSCGWGTQTIPLAKLGWQVTACDVSETSLEMARKYASQEGVSVDFRICDMRDLDQVFNQQFDWVVSCYSLYEIPTDEGIRQAVHGMFTALKPGGKCYLELGDMDDLMDEPRERHRFRGEKRVPNGRIICIQDWDYESESNVVAMEAFLREDESRAPSDHFRWVTETIGVRKKVLRKTELERFLLSEGFDPVAFLPKPQPWMEVKVVATRLE
jgi:glycine/sarcosine N-methyltransferase